MATHKSINTHRKDVIHHREGERPDVETFFVFESPRGKISMVAMPPTYPVYRWELYPLDGRIKLSGDVEGFPTKRAAEARVNQLLAV